MTANRAWIGCAIAGLATILVAIALAFIPNLVSCGPDHGLGPVMAFELARTPTDFALLFGEEPCRGALVEAMLTMLWIDALAFIPAYTALLVFALIALRGNGPKLAAAGIVAAVAGALFDEFEGVVSFAILGDLSGALPADPAQIAWLIPAVRGKFALLALATMAIGWLLSRDGGRHRLSGLVVTAGSAIMLIGLASVELGGLLTLGGLIAWASLFAVAVWRVVRERSDREESFERD